MNLVGVWPVSEDGGRLVWGKIRYIKIAWIALSVLRL